MKAVPVPKALDAQIWNSLNPFLPASEIDPLEPRAETVCLRRSALGEETVGGNQTA